MAGPIIGPGEPPEAFCLWVAGATVLACMLFVTKDVTVKLLPFDNKSELEVLANLPEGAAVEDTARRRLFAAARVTERVPEVRSIQIYAGTPHPQLQRPRAALPRRRLNRP